MNEAFYFVGSYGDIGHDEKSAGKEDGQGRAYPVFSTYNTANPDEKHTNAWFICKDDADEWASSKNTSLNFKRHEKTGWLMAEGKNGQYWIDDTMAWCYLEAVEYTSDGPKVSKVEQFNERDEAIKTASAIEAEL